MNQYNQNIHLSGNLLEEWIQNNHSVEAKNKKFISQTVISCFVALFMLTGIWFIKSGLESQVTQVHAKVVEASNQLAGMDEPDFSTEGAIALGAFLESTQNKNFEMLAKLGETLNATDSQVALDTVSITTNESVLSVQGSAKASGVGSAYAYTARLGTQDESAQTYLTGIEQLPNSNSGAVSLNFETIDHSWL